MKGQEFVNPRCFCQTCVVACRGVVPGRRCVMPTVDLTRDEIISTMDDVAKRRMGSTAQEVLRLYHRGELAEPGLVGDLLVLADLLSPDDPIFSS